MIHILLLDDHAILLDGLEAVLKNETDLKVVLKTSDHNMAVAYLKKGAVDLAITDYAMPNMDGASFTRKTKSVAPHVKIIMLSMHNEPNIVHDVMEAGADGYVLKKYAQQELIQAIRTVLSGRPYWSREISQALSRGGQQEEDASELTARELEVLKLLVDELSSKEIADRLFISERTVESHRKNLLRKTGSVNAVGLVKYAYQHKLC